MHSNRILSSCYLKRSAVTSVLFFCWLSAALGQTVNFPNSAYHNHLVDRLDILNGFEQHHLHTSFKGYYRADLLSLMKASQPTSQQDSFNLAFLNNDQFIWDEGGKPQHSRKIKIPFIYQYPSAFYAVNEKDFGLVINPILAFEGGSSNSDSISPFRNTRGFELSGHIGRKVGFYSSVTENQMRFPSYYNNSIDANGVVPGVGLYKPFGNSGVDFFKARGYFTFSPVKAIRVQFGHDDAFIGNGIRSLLLSNHARENVGLRIRTKVWKVQYTNLFHELSDLDRITGSGNGQQKKYSATHHLSLDLLKNLNIGLFETVVFSRQDSNQVEGFDMDYLNPIIFYRAVEHGLNSSDNVLVGLDWKWNIKRKISIYGQILLDEFVKNELIQRTGWWANKWGLQTGLKYINAFGVDNLDLQYELNAVRPYTYTHFNESQNYVHHNQPMAHPLGANFLEHIVTARFQPINRLNLTLTYIAQQQGLDSLNSSQNWGSNIRRNYYDRPQETGIPLLFGSIANTQILDFNALYQLKQNLFLIGNVTYRTWEHPGANSSTSDVIFTAGIRLNATSWPTF